LLKSLGDIFANSGRYKISSIICNEENLESAIFYVKEQNINVVNIGAEVANFINNLEDYRYLSIDVFDFIIKLLDKSKTNLNVSDNEIIAIYNLGILFEPDLKLNTTQLLKDYSKTTAIIIIWENETDHSNILNWQTNKLNYFIDLTDTQLKKLQYAI
jgi:hypothetical protein